MKNRTVNYMLLLMFISTINIFANDKMTTIYLGGGYNQYEIEDINDLSTDDVTGGISYMLGMNFRLLEKLKLGVEFDSVEAKWSDLDYRAATTGILFMLEYDLLAGPSHYGEGTSSTLSVFAGVGNYESGIYYDSDALLDEETASSTGYKAGIAYSADFSEMFGIQARIAYRKSEVEVDSLNLDFSGISGELVLKLSI